MRLHIEVKSNPHQADPESALPYMSSASESSVESKRSSSSVDTLGASRPRRDESVSMSAESACSGRQISLADGCFRHSLRAHVSNLYRANIIALVLFHHGPREPDALAALVGVDGALEQLTAREMFPFARFEHTQAWKRFAALICFGFTHTPR